MRAALIAAVMVYSTIWREQACMFRASSSLVGYSPHIHEHHSPQTEDRMDHQLQDTRASLALVTGFGSADSLQHQVAGGVAVPQRHVAQNLQSEHSRTTTVHLLINMSNLSLRLLLSVFLWA